MNILFCHDPLHRFLSLNGKNELYFGVNSVFNYKESEIFDFFFSGESQSDSKSIGSKDLQPVLSSWLRLPGKWLRPIQVNPYSQCWRQADEFVEALERGRFRDLELKDVVPDFDLIGLLCRVELARRHPEKFMSVIEPVVEKLHRALSNRELAPGIAAFFEKTVADHLHDFAAGSAAGGTLSLCVRYEEPSILEAALPLLRWETRYPYGGAKADDTVHELRTIGSGMRGARNSVRLVESLWSSGFVAKRVERLDDRTLFVEVAAPLEFGPTFDSLTYLCLDMRNLRERVESTRTISAEDGEDARPAPAVLLARPLLGPWRVSVVGWGGDYGEVKAGEDAGVTRIVDAGEAPEEFLPKLLDGGHLERIRSVSGFEWGARNWL